MNLYRKFYRLLFLLSVCLGAGCSEETPSVSVNAETINNPTQLQVSRSASTEDIDPITGSRLPPVDREELDSFGKDLYDSYIKAGRSFEEYAGPRGIRIHSPKVAEYMTTGNEYLRYESGIDDPLREMIILLAARGMDNKYEWTSHETTAQKVGLAQEVIDIIKYSRPVPTQLAEEQAVIIMLGREVLQDHAVKPDTFARALNLFGKKKLVDIVSLMAHYTATAILLTTFNQQLPPDQESLLP